MCVVVIVLEQGEKHLRTKKIKNKKKECRRGAALTLTCAPDRRC